MCEHLAALDNELKANGIAEIFRGQAWSDHCREWVYYDCVLDLEKIRQRHQFPDFVKIHVNADNKSGMEAGLVCEMCADAVIGVHPDLGKGKTVVE
ncbi:hypothetical protein [Flavobacterium sp.]|uniref:hypothetical protein n=1 Tax=Flavobacterium sp. TaxID=239 RepID=UPI0039E6FF12